MAGLSERTLSEMRHRLSPDRLAEFQQKLAELQVAGTGAEGSGGGGGGQGGGGSEKKPKHRRRRRAERSSDGARSTTPSPGILKAGSGGNSSRRQQLRARRPSCGAGTVRTRCVCGFSTF